MNASALLAQEPTSLLFATPVADALPDAPSTLLGYISPGTPQQDAVSESASAGPTPQVLTWHQVDPTPQAQKPGPPPCADVAQTLPLRSAGTGLHTAAKYPAGTHCIGENPLQPIVTAGEVRPLTPGQKAFLAVRDIEDPFNIITIVGYSGIVIAANSHTAYGPGFGGFGRLTGYSFLEDAQGEFFGTFLIPVLAREDPRYHRMPGKPIPRRVLHAVLHTFVSHHDDGAAMPNYATLLTYPISAELSNLYVPGVAVDGPSTAKRIAVGIATDPAGAMVAEFLPDIAKRIHIRIIFVQQILQKVAAGPPNMVQ